MLAVFGIFVFIFVHLSQNSHNNRVIVSLELNDDVNQAQIDSIRQALTVGNYCRPTSLKFYDKEEASKIMTEEFGDYQSILDENPFVHTFEFEVNAAYLTDSEAENKKKIEGLSNTLSLIAGVRDATYATVNLENIAQNLKSIAYIFLALFIIFLIISTYIIFNTIRLNLHSNRMIVKTMQLIGADPRFIKRPYLKRALIDGFVSGLLTCLVVSGFYIVVITQYLPQINDLKSILNIGLYLGGILLLGILISYLATSIGLNKYLRRDIDQVI